MSTKTKKSFIGWVDSWFPNCKEVTLLVVKEQEIKLSFFQKIKLHFHLKVCSFCRTFRIQSNLLHNHVHHLSQKTAKDELVFTMSEEKKSAMESTFLKSISGDH